MFEHGHGIPIVMIPGLPGPWRFIAPALHAVSRYYRVLALNLGPECTRDADVERIRVALDERKIDRAVICGISLGGLVALRFAATYPQRTSALILVSTPGPERGLEARHRLYTRWPHLFALPFLLESPFRVRHEWRWSLLKLLRGRPISFSKMARRARWLESTDIAADCARVTAPTLVVTGERALDHVVRVDSTLKYLEKIHTAGHVTLRDTGHLGSVTQPELFRAVVEGYVGELFKRTA